MGFSPFALERATFANTGKTHINVYAYYDAPLSAAYLMFQYSFRRV